MLSESKARCLRVHLLAGRIREHFKQELEFIRALEEWSGVSQRKGDQVEEMYKQSWIWEM